jgi:hypothetical protein
MTTVAGNPHRTLDSSGRRDAVVNAGLVQARQEAPVHPTLRHTAA